MIRPCLKRTVVALALVAGAAAAQPSLAAQCTLAQKKQIVSQFYNGLMRGDIDTLHRLGRADYRQHNPAYETGLQGLENRIKARPAPAPGTPPPPPLSFVRVIAEGDYVMSLRRMPPGPNAPPGPDNERANVDIFRVQDCKVAEHWDYQEQFPRGTEPPKNSNGHF